MGGGDELGSRAGVGVVADGGGDSAWTGGGGCTGVGPAMGCTVGTVWAWVGCACGAILLGGRVGARCRRAGRGFGFSTGASNKIVSAQQRCPSSQSTDS